MRNAIRLLLVLSCLVSLRTFASADLLLMPYPQQVELESGLLVVSDTMTYSIAGYDSPRLQQALVRFEERIERQTGLPMGLKKSSLKKDIVHVSININTDAAERKEATIGTDESYKLRITDKQIYIYAETTLGALHAFETLLQLPAAWGRAHAYPLVTITDAPRFKWRGALIDVARHFISLETLKRQIDAMAAAKLNVFHWHLTDDQGWRIESKVFPLLQQKASGGKYYTQAQIRELVDYAWQRGIYVLPEIDMPGHVSALALAFPELMSAPGPYQQEERWGVHKPTLNPANENVYIFIERLLAEVATLFPFEYVHIGGDEVDPQHWLENAAIQEFMREEKLADHRALQAFFNRRVVKMLARNQRKMIGWDEIQHPDLPRDIVIQSWQGPDALGQAVNNGFNGILSTGFYLDQPQPAAYHYRNEIIPRPLAVDDQVRPGERWSTWDFSMPRKRGSAVRGTFTLITDSAGQERGFIDFAGKSRKALNNIFQCHGVTHFELDTWMGKVSSRLRLNAGELTGSMIVGNVHYSASGKKIAGSDIATSAPPVAINSTEVGAQQQPLILGGELALWSEMVNEDVIDLRLWPRGFVVAERLWSAANLSDEDNMYERMEAIADWSVHALDLRHYQQQRAQLEQLVDTDAIEPLLVLSEAVEQAQYYHRHHEKSAHGFYSRQDPLNLFVDSLPAESVQVYELDRQVENWLANPDDRIAKLSITSQLNRWIASYPAAVALAREAQQENLEVIAQYAQMVSRLGLHLIARIEEGRKLTAGEVREARALLYEAQQMHEEVVVSAAYPIEKLLDAAY